jgi:hypothetical protein
MVRLLTSSAMSHGESECAELVRVIAGLKLHITEQRAIAAEAAVEAEGGRQRRVHAGNSATGWTTCSVLRVA